MYTIFIQKQYLPVAYITCLEHKQSEDEDLLPCSTGYILESKTKLTTMLNN